MQLANALNNTDFVGLTLFPCADGWQASLRSSRDSGWRVETAALSADAILAVLQVREAVAISPPPY